MTAQPRDSLRSDARDNRERILAAARAAFAAGGLDVPVREVARQAGVGVATVYRHFPAKEDLLSEAFSERMASCTEIVETALAQSDPWRGFCLVIERLMYVHALDRGLARAFTSRLPRADDLAAERNRILFRLRTVIDRAKDAGELRPDFVLDDLVLVLMANEGIRAGTPEQRTAAARRFAALVIESFRARPASPRLPPPARLPLAWQGPSGAPGAA